MSQHRPRPVSAKRKRAAALRYRREIDSAPRVVATGSGRLAERIVAAARAAGVPVREDPLLVDALAKLDLGSEIPPELYAAVAELLVWAYQLDRRLQSG
ncbi:EscU/YscU/HrcU family type III secretion system export apparatus switch protein [Thermoleophilum album]|uniref:EscU/YscU/HrcU family type III secretion system export apparatus switch protein n=1 Tax=Thermoleophilum album TaxID=29539 RepID=UPI00237CADDF|nr:EscU/YscU/HrcU family type III secretion system export apparatus switch protein [Thermoleophilum album]